MIHIPWEDGSGEYLHLSTDSGNGDATITVTSDPNDTGVQRDKELRINWSNQEAILTVNQDVANVVRLLLGVANVEGGIDIIGNSTAELLCNNELE